MESQYVMEAVSGGSAQQNQTGRPAVPGEHLEEHLGAIRNLVASQDVSQREVGVHVNVIESQRLAQEAGFKSAQACFKEKLDCVPRATLHRFATVASRFSEEDARRWGTTKLELVARYEKRIGESLVGDPADYDIRLPGPDGTELVKKLQDCSTADLRKAARKEKSDRNAEASHLETQPSDAARHRLAAAALGILVLAFAVGITEGLMSAISVAISMTLIVALAILSGKLRAFFASKVMTVDGFLQRIIHAGLVERFSAWAGKIVVTLRNRSKALISRGSSTRLSS